MEPPPPADPALVLRAALRSLPVSDPLGFVWTVSTRRVFPFDSAEQAAGALIALVADGPSSGVHAAAEAIELAYAHEAGYLRAVHARVALAWRGASPIQRLCLDRLAAAADLAAARVELGDPPFFLLLWLLGVSRPPSCHPAFAHALTDSQVTLAQLDDARATLTRRSPGTLALIELDLRAVRRLLAARA